MGVYVETWDNAKRGRRIVVKSAEQRSENLKRDVDMRK